MTVRSNPTALGADDGPVDTISFLFAPGVTWYLMPENLFVSGSVGLAVGIVSLELRNALAGHDEHHEQDTAYGVGVTASVGKEWWASENWSLGAAVDLSFANAWNDRGALRQLGARLTFTATYN
jgi:hypothetical protein